MWHVQLSGPLPLPVSAFVFYPPFPAWSEYLLDTGAPKLPHHKLWNRSIKSRYFVSVPGSMMSSLTQALLNTCHHMPIPVGPVYRMPGTPPTELDMVFVRPTMKDVVKLQHREGSPISMGYSSSVHTLLGASSCDEVPTRVHASAELPEESQRKGRRMWWRQEGSW